MSEQKVNYMAQLDAWSDVNVIAPLVYEGDTGEKPELTQETIEQVKKAIREKNLESFKNGLKAPRRPAAPAVAVVRR
jgi:hypothetical protein